MQNLHLEANSSIVDGKSRRLTRLVEDGTSRPLELFHEFDRVVPFTDATVLDGHVLTILLYASSLGKPLAVHGPLSRGAMRNIEELLLAWSCWKPGRYKKIDIIPERILDVRRGPGEAKAISAFSGGVDATFTALRHAQNSAPSRYPLRAALMVHGFDVDLYNTGDFDRLVARVKPLLDELRIETRVVRTNSRDLKLQQWDNSHALELAGCLHMYSEEFDYGLIGSSEPYDALKLPWGSNPATDHLMSGDRMSIIHDGAGFSRIDKVAHIMSSQMACRALKVCWAGADQSGNCGRCEKCLRTQLNFFAAGATGLPPCFPEAFNLGYLNSIKIDNLAQLVELTSIIEYADNNSVTGDWIGVLRDTIPKHRQVDFAAVSCSRRPNKLKSALVRAITAVRLDVPAKKIWRPFRRRVLGAVR